MERNKLLAVLSSMFLSLSATGFCVAKEEAQRAVSHAASGESDSVAQAYQLLIAMQPARAIRKLVPPLISALRAKDTKTASRVLRLIAFAFRLDENDRCAAQMALNAVALDPASDAAKLDAAEYLFRCGQWQKAKKLSHELQQSKDAAISLIAVSQDCLRNIEFAKAIAMIQNAPKAIQSNLRVLRMLALLYQMNEDYKAAAQLYERLASSCGSSYMKEIYLGRGDVALTKFDLAKDHFLKAGKIEQNDPLWLSELGLMEMKQNHIQEARSYLRSAIQQERLSSQAHVNFAILEAYFGNTQDAFGALQHVSVLRPGAADAAFATGLVNEKLEDYKQARIAFNKALELNPYNGSAYQHLLNVERHQKLHSDEIETANRWIKNSPASFLAHAECGKTYFNAGEKEKARRSFDQAKMFAIKRGLHERSSVKSTFLTLLANSSVSYFDLGETEKAFEDALAFNQKKPAPAKAGGMYVRPPKLDLSKVAPKSKQMDAIKHALIADVLYEVQNLGGAEAQYKLAINEEPDNIVWHSCRLKVLIDQKNLVEAAKEDLYVSQHTVTHIPDAFKQ